MATTTEVTARVDRGLRSLLTEVADLPNLAAEWERLSDGERASIALDWDHLMATYLPELDRLYRSHEMNVEQQARYRTLLHTLHDALPIIERLALFRPPVALGV